jgi:hypothetical protein
MSDERQKELDAVLIGMAGRRLSVGEIIKALGMSSTTYYQQRADDRLITAENLIKAARNLGLNELELLVRYGFINPAAIADYVEMYGAGPTKPRATMRGRRPRLWPDFVAPVEPADL